jgi:hypothetical protein
MGCATRSTHAPTERADLVNHDYEAAMARVPDYQRFLTVDEMIARARAVAAAHPELASIEVVGHSTDGEPMEMVRIGDGPQRMLLFACPHPNEPIGAMLIQFLLDELITNEPLRAGRSWYLLPCVDPDGTRLNEGWFAGPFTIRNYARHFYRPRSEEQVEWSFPVTYKKYAFDAPIPETRALMQALEQVQPHFVYSLHNAGFGGVYYYLTHDVPEAYAALHDIPKRRELFLSLGEAEMPWAVEFHPAVYKTPTLADAYDHHERYGEGSPETTMQGGASSFDHLRALGLDDTVALITELPYFQARQIEDQTPVAASRREVIVEGVNRTRQMVESLEAVLDAIGPHMTLDTRFYRTVTSFARYFRDHLDSKRRWAETAEGMDRSATVAQQADELHVGTFYRLLIASMLRRAIDAQLALGSVDELLAARERLEADLDRWATQVEQNLDSAPIPIKKLVEVQYGAMLAVLDSGRVPTG